jgi:hypothetical protein
MTDNTVTPMARPPWLFLAFNFLFSRLWLVIIAGMSLLVFKRGKDYIVPHSILDLFNQWDAEWYLNIARHGYTYTPGKNTGVVFFPLYPVLVRLLTFGGTVDARLVAYLVSNGALFCAVVLLWKLAVFELRDESCSKHVVQFLLFNPMTVFYSSIYTESLYLLFLVSTLYLARTQRWLLAAACAYAAGLCRVVGVLLVVPLACEWFLQNRHNLSWRSAGIRRALIACAAPALGFLTYVAYLNWTFGEPLAFLKAERPFGGRRLTWPWLAFKHLHRYELFYVIWFLSFLVMAVGLFILAVRWRFRPTYLVVFVIFTMICVCSSVLESLPRYLSVLFPFYFVLALATKKWPDLTVPLFVGSTILQVISTILFVNGYWLT